MSNSELFKQAIAEAKTIREAAIANAKEALEETLTPHLKDMLAAKLQEMEEEEAYEDEVVNEEDLINDPEDPTTHGNVAEAEEEESEEAPEEEAEEEEEESEEGEEEIDLENMTVEDLTDLIKSIVDQELGQEGEEDYSMEDEDAPDMEDASNDEEEIDINEILSELDEYEDGEEDGEHFDLYAAEPESNVDYEGPSQSDDIQAAALEIVKANPELTWGEALRQAQAKPAEPIAEEEELDEKLEETERKSDLYGVLAPYGTEKEIDAYVKKVRNNPKYHGWYVDDMIEDFKNFIQDKKDSALKEESSEMKVALATIDELKTQLHEVNLLNAKLLYVNKIFKDNSLTESQKVNVVAAFDKAETVKEVKLVYETVSKNVTSKPNMVKEHRSFASKPVGATKVPQKTEIISEVSDTVKRLQKLAGIIK